MRKEFRVVLIFGLAQLLLSIFVWGSLEYSIMSGDIIQNAEASFWSFVLGDRLIWYLVFSVVNSVLFAIISIALRPVFHPSKVGAVVMAVGTIVLAVPLVFNSAFRVPYPLVSVAAFFISSMIYGVVVRTMEKRKAA